MTEFMQRDGAQCLGRLRQAIAGVCAERHTGAGDESLRRAPPHGASTFVLAKAVGPEQVQLGAGGVLLEREAHRQSHAGPLLERLMRHFRERVVPSVQTAGGLNPHADRAVAAIGPAAHDRVAQQQQFRQVIFGRICSVEAEVVAQRQPRRRGVVRRQRG